MPGRDAPSAYAEFIERHALGDLPQIEDVDGSLWNHFGIFSQPAWILFDRNGNVNRGRGPLPEELIKPTS